MFFIFAQWLAGRKAPFTQKLTLAEIEALFRLHPQTLLSAVEQFFSKHASAFGSPAVDYVDPGSPQIPATGVLAPLASSLQNEALPNRWDHIIYPYLIENTRIVEVFDRALREFGTGERFKTPDAQTALWLRTTETLFFRDLGSSSIGSLTSWLRPDLRATRRNTYYRLLGLDLNHGLDGQRAYQFEKPVAANRDFIPTFEAFLREVWRGSMNASNSVGPNESDDAAIADHVRRLRDMLLVRRDNGNLLREELWAAVTMSWFHLTVSEDTPIVRALKADAESEGQRTRILGERTGVPVHSRADDYFSMARELSAVLSYIEREPNTATATAASAFYRTAPSDYAGLPADMRTIITHWSAATGRDIKAQRVTTGSAPPLPLRDRSSRGEAALARVGSRGGTEPGVRTNGS